MILAVPEDTPVTVPEDTPTVAIAPLLVVQLPPKDVLPKVVVAPTHILAVPLIAEGVALTVNIVVA